MGFIGRLCNHRDRTFINVNDEVGPISVLSITTLLFAMKNYQSVCGGGSGGDNLGQGRLVWVQFQRYKTHDRGTSRHGLLTSWKIRKQKIDS